MMENVKEITQKESVIEANSPKHYNLIVIGLIVGLFGIALRFVSDWEYINYASNILFALGSYICLKAVLNILK